MKAKTIEEMLEAGETSKELKEALWVSRGLIKYGGYDPGDLSDLTPKELIGLAEKADAEFQSAYDEMRGK